VRELDDVFFCQAWFSDCVVNWTAVAGIANLIAAAITVLAVFAAVYSVRAALRIDRNQAARLEQREKRDAIPLAAAIGAEILRARVAAGALVEKCQASPSDAWDTIKMAQWCAPRTEAPILERALLSLGCFDAPTAIVIATCATTISELHSFLDNPNFPKLVQQRPDRWPDEIAEGLLSDLVRLSNKTIRDADLALKLIRRYVTPESILATLKSVS